MTGIKRSVAIKNFLLQHTWPDLAAMYTDEMEVQINVAQDGGECIDRYYQGKNWREYTDNAQTWGPFRIPRNSMNIPEDNDFNIKFDLPLHVEGVGMTGWNWKQKKSLWVAFDFDAIVGHSERHSRKLNPVEIEEIRQKVATIPWVTIRRSTSGSGLHLYVFIDENVFRSAINNHNEHMAVGRAILSQLSSIAGFDLEAKVDVYAGNMWVWHRKMLMPDGERKPESLLLIKQGEKLKEIPTEWKDYIDVVSGKRRRTVPFFVKGQDESAGGYDEFEELSNQRPKIPLDAEHQKLLDWIQTSTPGGSWWRDDHHMLVTHTYTLKLAHKALNLRGSYDTLALGTEHGSDHNCYLFPMPRGAWRARRFTKGCTEHSFWTQDGRGWTSIWFNKLPDFKTACKLNDGVERSNGGFVFKEAKQAIAAARMLGANIGVSERMLTRTAVLKQHRDKRLLIEIEKETKDTADGMDGYDGTGKTWNKIVDGKIDQMNSYSDTMHLDKIIRHVVNEGDTDEGWVVKSAEEWRDEPLEHVKLILKGHFGYKPADVDQILGTGVIQPYKIINRPFDVEYPPGRLWNRRGAKFRFQPSQDIDNLSFPTWLKILEHLGTGIDPIVQDHPWAKANSIKNGADYLLLWVAAKFQRPYDRLPYLFFYSDEQNTGKSTFHEALALLLDGDPPRGYMKVNEALKATAQFNAELQHAILCVVEELDLNPKKNDAKISYNRIKELVTANNISIHEKRQTPIMVKNSTAWVQCANDKTSCPIFQNDSRITMIRVHPLDEVEIIPKKRLLEALVKEAPHFMAHILRLEIPESNDRLMVPVMETEDKRRVQRSNLNPLEQFLDEECEYVEGHTIKWSEFYDKLLHWLEPSEAEKFTKRYCGLHMPERFPRARRREDAQYYVGNIRWKSSEPNNDPPKPRLIVKADFLMSVKTDNNGATNLSSDQENVTNGPENTNQ
jgi:hypothetical protein